MPDPKTLMFIGAHPDDETFGMGGTFAHYARLGCRTYYVCATRGEAGEADAKFLKLYPSMGDLRWAELTAAARELGLTEVVYLGYRDSGMQGSQDNQNPAALINAPQEQVIERMVTILRRIRPEVVVTFDPIGGYRHPDHIAVHQAAVAAFQAAADPSRFPASGAPFQPAKLYFGVFPHHFLKVAVKLLPIFGRDPHKWGKNRDIDLTAMIDPEFPVHAWVKLSRRDLEIRRRASACHASQMGDTSPQSGIFGLVFWLSSVFSRLSGEKEYYMRWFPTPAKKVKREKDLFAGLN
jgi:N-acetyl-1-D-myo-inositol-2-amino-2-deoxy-alpha-D-glucopyranoside deacetylase